ncbi:MAG: hypothetical protein ACE5KM_24070, partial [Planctomycetaceae bacterium]
FLLATTHEDILADLAPSLHVRCRLDGEITVKENRTAGGQRGPETESARKKKDGSPSQTNCASPQRPKRTGRTSLGGITAATTSASPGT